VKPKAIFTINGIDLEAPRKEGKYTYHLSLKTSKQGDYFGEKLALGLNVIYDDQASKYVPPL
jgi:hypothetical protein